MKLYKNIMMIRSPIPKGNSCLSHWIYSESLGGSFDTDISMMSESSVDKHPVFQPSQHKFLFQELKPETLTYYEHLNNRLERILGALEEALPPVNIRDDCSINAKTVFLRLPDRRKTVPPKFS